MLTIQQVIDALPHHGMSDGAQSEDIAHLFIKRYSQFIDGKSRQDLLQLTEDEKIKLLQHFDVTSSLLLEHLPQFTNEIGFSKLSEIFHSITGHEIDNMTILPKELSSNFFEFYCAIMVHPHCPLDVLHYGIALSPYEIGKTFAKSKVQLDRFIDFVNSLPITDRFNIFLNCGVDTSQFDIPTDGEFISLLSSKNDDDLKLFHKYTQRLLECGYQLSEDVLRAIMDGSKFSRYLILKQNKLSFADLKAIAKEKYYVGNHPNWPLDKVISSIGSNANSAYNHTHAGLYRLPKEVLLKEINSPVKAQSLTAMASAEGLPGEVYEAVLDKLISNVNVQWDDPQVELASDKTPLVGAAYALYCFVRNDKIPSHIISLAIDELRHLKNQNLASYFKKTIYMNAALSSEMCVSELGKIRSLPYNDDGKTKELLTALLLNKNMPPKERGEFINFNSVSIQKELIHNIIDRTITLPVDELLAFYKRLKVESYLIADLAKFIYPQILSCGNQKLLRMFLSINTKPHLATTFVNCIGHLFTCKNLDSDTFNLINGALSKVIDKAYDKSGSKPDGLNNSTINRMYVSSISTDFICGVYSRVREKFNFSFNVDDLSKSNSLPAQLARLRGQEVLDFFVAQNLKARLTRIEQEREPTLELAKPRTRCL